MAETVINIADELLASMQKAVDIVEGHGLPCRVWNPPASVNVPERRSR